MGDGIFELAGAAFSLDRAALVVAREAAGAGQGLILALLAGLSLTVGQSVVLFGNGVSARRFVLCLLLFDVANILGLLVWAASIWTIAVYGLGLTASPGAIALAVGMGQAPMLFGFLILIPYFGASIRRILEAYSLVIVVAALCTFFEIRPLTALAMSVLGWAFKLLVVSLLQRPLAGMRLWLWQVVSGRLVYVAPRELWQALAAGDGPDDHPRLRR
jgi:hypothetical protein